MIYKKGLTLLIAVMITVMLSPFSIYADTQIVPTYSSSAQTWVNTNGYVYVTNYCEGTSASTNSCKLTFTLNSNWYGMIYIDGYDSSNTQWINYQPVFIADGHGEYNYNFWQSSQKVISKVTILSINLVKPNTTVDLSQIIQLLTAIENDTSSIDITLDNTLSQITNVLNQLIVSNGYLETISKYREYNFPMESYTFVNQFVKSGFQITDFYTNSSYQYPLFFIPANTNIFSSWSNSTADFNQVLILGVSKNIYNEQSFYNYFDVTNFKLISLSRLYRKDYPNTYQNQFSIFKLVYNTTDSNTANARITFKEDTYCIPIYHEYLSQKNISTEFALVYGLTNTLLDNIDIIANGTSASQSAAVDSQTANSQLETSSNQLFTQEDSFKSDMNNAMQNIPSFSVNNFGSKFMSSATWVRQQYERMTNNTPFQQVITFSLLVGLSMILIGKVRK